MNDFTDRELLLEFARRGNEAAFAEIVRRYGGLVFGAALRRSGDHGLAEETAQNVFTILARKAAALAEHPALAAWLQKTAAFESARAVEKEQNRRRTMSAYQKEQSAAEGNPEEAWQAALPLLDDAVAALPEPDRQVLLLRYWQSQPYKNIASALGSSVDACEKRAGRALEKLSRLMRRRGVVLGTAALGAGLTPALTKAAASPAILARLTPAALAAAKTSPAAGWFSLLLMKSKLSLTISAIVLLALCGTAGWFAGAAQSKSRAEQKSGVRSGSGGPQASGGNGSGVAAAGDKNLKADPRQQLRALLEAVQRDLLTSDYDPAAKARAAARVAQIAPGDMRAALELIAAFPGGLKGQDALTSLLLQQWAQSDGPAACEYALTRVPKPQLGMPPVSDPLKAWAVRDPRAALAWFRQRAGKMEAAAVPTERWMPISSIRWIMGAWALQDTPAAVQEFLKLTDKQEISGAIIGFTEASGSAPSRTPILDAILKLKKDEHQGNTLMDVGRILQQWSSERPEELARWLDQQNVPKSYHGSLGKSILQGWLRVDAPAAVEWWTKAPGGYPEGAGRLDDIVIAWTESDVFAAAEWLAKQPLDKNAARAMASLSAKVAQSDVERGWEWALSIPEKHYRKDALRQVVSTWVNQDKAAAEAAVQGASLDEALKTELLKTISQTPQK
ncbi:MAG TPA: sigma-70 family RNA polymerase sigma factor [Verrucomicrobiales bacterium]|nr:sigma-70 family RNA polymerase sigma factor [Verrucomicrobiales bacterium]